MKLLFPVIALIVSLGLFFLFTNPHYTKLKELKAEQAQYSQALDKSKELRAIRDRLQETNKNIPQADLDRLARFLPDHIDNVRLAMDIDAAASRYGMRLGNVSISKVQTASDTVIGAPGKRYDSVNVSFTVAASYDTFRKFLTDLESSLRLVDVIGLSFDSSRGDFYEYAVTLRTYWLK